MKNFSIIGLSKQLLVCIALVTLIVSCKKKTEEPECTSCAKGGGPPAQPNLNWKENGGGSTFAESYKFYSASNTLSGTYNGTNIVLNIKFTASVAGTYPITATGTNKVIFVKNGFAYSATSGNLYITSNSNNKISGSFYSYGDSGGITSLVGDFTDVPVQ